MKLKTEQERVKDQECKGSTFISIHVLAQRPECLKTGMTIFKGPFSGVVKILSRANIQKNATELNVVENIG